MKGINRLKKRDSDIRRMNYLPSDDQFRSAPASSAHVTGCRIGDCTAESTFRPQRHQRRAAAAAATPHPLTRTCVLCPGAHGHGAGLAHAHAVPGQHSELVLHPGVEVHDGGRQRVAVNDLRD